MFIVSFQIDQIYNYFPKHSVGAEVGVKAGKNAKIMFRKINPSKFFLIDPWGIHDEDKYLDHMTKDEMDTLYNNVLQWANSLENSGRVDLVRDYSFNAAVTFPDKFFDWVYIDGMHDYENIYRDLSCFAEKVKDDGFLCGDDYWYTAVSVAKKKVRRNLTPEQEKSALGMVEGVNDFCRDFGYDLLFITMDDAPKFFLAKQGRECYSRKILDRVLVDAPFIIEVEDPRKFRQDMFVPSDATSREQWRPYIKIAR